MNRAVVQHSQASIQAPSTPRHAHTLQASLAAACSTHQPEPVRPLPNPEAPAVPSTHVPAGQRSTRPLVHQAPNCQVNTHYTSQKMQAPAYRQVDVVPKVKQLVQSVKQKVKGQQATRALRRRRRRAAPRGAVVWRGGQHRRAVLWRQA